MAACVCGHSEEEHPGRGPCEGDPMGALVREGGSGAAGGPTRCGCVMYEPED